MSGLCVATPPDPPFTRGGKEGIAHNRNARLAAASRPQESQDFHQPSFAIPESRKAVYVALSLSTMPESRAIVRLIPASRISRAPTITTPCRLRVNAV